MTEPDDEAFAARSLSALPEIQPSRDLLRRVAQIPIAHPRQREVFSVRQWAFGLLTAALLGLAAGWFTLGADELDRELPPVAAAPGSEDEVPAERAGDETQTETDAEGAELEGMLAFALGSDDASWEDELEQP